MKRTHGCILALVAACSCALAAGQTMESRLWLEDRLTLSPVRMSHELRDEQGVQRVLQGLPPEAVEPLDDVVAPKLEGSVTDVRGVNYADFKNHVVAVAYRGSSGLGLGVASTGGLALTGGYATEGGMQIAVYYVRTFTELAEDAARAAGLELSGALPERSVGITIGWKF